VAQASDLVMKIQDGEIPGKIKTGFPSLDKYALSPGKLIAIGARPSVGKSALMLHLADNIMQDGHPVLYVSLEMDPSENAQRMISRWSKIPVDRFTERGYFKQQEWSDFAKAAERIVGKPGWFLEDESLPRIIATAEQMRRTEAIAAVFIDYIGLVEMPHAEKRYLQIQEATRSLKQLAHKSGLQVYLACQFNRGAEETEAPKLSHFRESGSIEQDADACWLLHRPRKGQDDDDELKIGVAKNRNGPEGVVTLRYEAGRLWEETNVYTD
jgi:replicative DNA helicase